jgi:hypothetical protein
MPILSISHATMGDPLGCALYEVVTTRLMGLPILAESFNDDDVVCWPNASICPANEYDSTLDMRPRLHRLLQLLDEIQAIRGHRYVPNSSAR